MKAPHSPLRSCPDKTRWGSTYVSGRTGTHEAAIFANCHLGPESVSSLLLALVVLVGWMGVHLGWTTIPKYDHRECLIDGHPTIEIFPGSFKNLEKIQKEEPPFFAFLWESQSNRKIATRQYHGKYILFHIRGCLHAFARRNLDWWLAIDVECIDQSRLQQGYGLSWSPQVEHSKK